MIERLPSEGQAHVGSESRRPGWWVVTSLALAVGFCAWFGFHGSDQAPPAPSGGSQKDGPDRQAPGSLRPQTTLSQSGDEPVARPEGAVGIRVEQLLKAIERATDLETVDDLLDGIMALPDFEHIYGSGFEKTFREDDLWTGESYRLELHPNGTLTGAYHHPAP